MNKPSLIKSSLKIEDEEIREVKVGGVALNIQEVEIEI